MQDDNNRRQQLALEHEDMLRLALLYLAVQRVIHATRELVTHYNVHDCMDFWLHNLDNHYLVWILQLLIVPVLVLFETLLQIVQTLVFQ